MRNMGGLGSYLPTTFRTMWIATLAIAGIPPLAGFFSKDAILAVAFARGQAEPYWYLVWGLGAAAALLTAFYMARLMLYTFHGPNRTGDAERAHLAESPAVMTVPLVLLAVLTVLGGLANLPEGLPGAGWLGRWLEPAVGVAASMAGRPELGRSAELTLVGVAVVLAAAGLWLAWTRLKPEELRPAERAPAETGFAKLLAEKYRIDELYDAVVVRPVVWVSRNVFWKVLDEGAIDAAGVNGSALVARTVGWLGTRLQTGQVGVYVAVFVVGVLALLGALVR
jgi:NADH-quinone oxidoreductase subunit L